MNEVEAAYVGCCIDTDGCVSIRPPSVRIAVTNQNLEIHSALLRATGKGSIYFGQEGVRGIVWNWVVGRREDVLIILERVKQYSTKAQKALELYGEQWYNEVAIRDGKAWLPGVLAGSAVQTAKTHCPQGHPYDEINTRYRKRGSRDCRACDRIKHT